MSSRISIKEACFTYPLHHTDHRRYRLHHRWILLCPLVRRRWEGDTSKDHYQVESYCYHSLSLLVRPCQTCSHTLMRHYIIFLMKYSLLAIILLMTIPAFSYAVWGDFIAPPGTIDIGSPSEIISKIIVYIIGATWIGGVIGITWWGIQMIMSVWEDEKMKKWRYMVIYSIVGVILAGLAYSIVKLIWNLRI